MEAQHDKENIINLDSDEPTYQYGKKKDTELATFKPKPVLANLSNIFGDLPDVTKNIARPTSPPTPEGM